MGTRRINKAICNRYKRQRERENIPRKQTRITDFFDGHDANRSLQIQCEEEIVGIEFFQINNQKRIISNSEIMRLAESERSFCILGQEPSTFGFNVTGLNSGHTIIQAPTERPRAYIACHKLLKAWPVEDLCSRDVAVAIIDSGMKDAGKLLVTSVYWDGRIDTFPEVARDAAKLAREKDYTLVMGGDYNARNVIFGSSTTDNRGMKIEDIMVTYDLESANKGSTPTCTASHPGSVIDATFINSEKSDLIQDWRVSQQESFSDHKLICFSIKGPKLKPERLEGKCTSIKRRHSPGTQEG